MKSITRSFTQRTVLAALLVGCGVLAASAYAMSTGGPADGTPRCEAQAGKSAHGGFAAKRAAHLAALKDKLKLAPGQEPAWRAFAESLQPGPRHDRIERGAMREQFAQLSTPERLDRMQAMAEQRQARMAQRAEAVKAFYVQLTPEQQRVFDAEALPQRHAHTFHRHHRPS